MVGRKQVNEEALRRVLARLKAQGWAVATQDLPTEPDPQLDQGPLPPEPASPSSAEEVAAMPLDSFGSRSLMLRVWAQILDAEIWFVSGEVQVRILQGRGIPREEIYTAQELAALLELFEQDAERVRLVLEAKKLFGGSVRLEKAP